MKRRLNHTKRIGKKYGRYGDRCVFPKEDDRSAGITRTSESVIHERSCGAIVFIERDSQLYALLIQHGPGHWSFPKGHMEQGESEHETAIREVSEETGIDIEITSDFQGESTYSPRAGRLKTVTFFLGNYLGGEIRPQEKEVRQVRWMRPDEAISLLTFDRDQAIFLEALEHYLKHEYKRASVSLLKTSSDTFSLKEKYTVEELLAIMRFLRSDEGCPWDRVQTHESIQGNFLEEAYEAVDAIQQKDPVMLCEELGDVMMQVVFHAQISDEEGEFTFEDVVSGICRKLISRHSHLFGSDVATTPDEVLTTWEKNKRVEKGIEGIVQELKDVPMAMPALTRSYKLQKRAARIGFDWPSIDGAREKMKEEMKELFDEVDSKKSHTSRHFIKDVATEHSDVDSNDAKEAVSYESTTREKIFEEAGDLLFAVVNVLRILKVDPEAALSAASGKFIRRFIKMDELAREKGLTLEGLTLEEMDSLWDTAKSEENVEG